MIESKELILLEELSALIAGTADLQSMLDRATTLLAGRMGVQVCSIYLLESDRLVLRATQGLNRSAVGQTSMTPDEGLTGLTFQGRKPLNVDQADRHPRFKYFQGIGEEAFGSYLGVPLTQRHRTVGVLSVQTRERRSFSPDEIRMFVAAAGHLAGAVVNAELLAERLHGAQPPSEETGPVAPFVRGNGVAAGVGRGALLCMTDSMDLETVGDAPDATVDQGLERFDAALKRAIADVTHLRDKVTASLGEEDGAIFHAHILMLEDRSMQERVRDRIRDGMGAVSAMVTTAHEYIDTFLRLDDPYLRERAEDVRDMAHRVVAHLRGHEASTRGREFSRPTVILAVDLTPSQMAQFIQPNLKGVALTHGGANSHTAILCRSAGIPALVGANADILRTPSGVEAILDGNTGILYISPPPTIVAEYERLAADSAAFDLELRAHAGQPSATLDGVAVRLFGNAALMSDIPRIVEAGAEGIGLYRTEFPFLIRSSFPNEEDQYQAYSRAVERMGGREVTFRTLDIGGDKPLPYLSMGNEENPQLGWRSLRISFDMEEIFREQVRALLRASSHGPIRIMLPMVTGVPDMEHARRIVEEERRQLTARGFELGPSPLGAMIEIPSAAVTIDRLTRVSEFFSIGTNDLAQYLLAVDRGNPKVGHLYDPLHPAVLDMTARVADACRAAGRPLSVCGELAAGGLGAAGTRRLGHHRSLDQSRRAPARAPPDPVHRRRAAAGKGPAASRRRRRRGRTRHPARGPDADGNSRISLERMNYPPILLILRDKTPTRPDKSRPPSP